MAQFCMEDYFMKKISVIIIGAGNRGERYATHMTENPENVLFSEKCKIRFD